MLGPEGGKGLENMASTLFFFFLVLNIYHLLFQCELHTCFDGNRRNSYRARNEEGIMVSYSSDYHESRGITSEFNQVFCKITS